MTHLKITSLLLPAVLAAGLAGCAATPGQDDAHVHDSAAASEEHAMCDMHRKMMMSGKPPAERQAMMQEHMKSMPAEKRQRMQAMQEKCR